MFLQLFQQLFNFSAIVSTIVQMFPQLFQQLFKCFCNCFNNCSNFAAFFQQLFKCFCNCFNNSSNFLQVIQQLFKRFWHCLTFPAKIWTTVVAVVTDAFPSQICQSQQFSIMVCKSTQIFVTWFHLQISSVGLTSLKIDCIVFRKQQTESHCHFGFKLLRVLNFSVGLRRNVVDLHCLANAEPAWLSRDSTWWPAARTRRSRQSARSSIWCTGWPPWAWWPWAW